MIAIGEWLISNYPEGGLWMKRASGEGMQLVGENLEAFKKLLGEFWEERF